jgi:hypothetical protein
MSSPIESGRNSFKLSEAPKVNPLLVIHIRGEGMDSYHINKNEQRWELVKEGAQRASKTAATKAEITQIASEFLHDKTASLKIHKEDGTIQEERTFPRAADPRKTKG